MKYLSVAISIILSGISAFASNNLTSVQKASILSKFSTEVKYNFVHYNKVKNYWDSLYNESFERIVNTPDDYSFIREMEHLCAELKDGHTNFFMDLRDIPNEENIRPLPFTTKRIGEKIYVTEVMSSKYLNEGVDIGTEVLEIDRIPVITYCSEEIDPFIPSSTEQWKKYSGAYNFDLTKKPGNEPTEVTFRNRDGRIFKVKSSRILKWDIPMNAKKNFIISILPDNIGLLRINSFDNNGNNSFNSEILRAAIDSLQNTNALIIDLRDNSGGSSANSDLLLQMLSSDSIPGYTWTTPQYVAAFASWNRPNQYYSQTTRTMAGMGLYSKPVVVLQNNGSFSSTENFISLFKGIKRGITIGEITGGSTGNPIYINLGYGASAIICTKNDYQLDGSEFVGIGIKPDIEVIQTEEIFIGKDNVLEAAINYLNDILIN